MNTKVCMTGHRPKALPWGDDEQDERCIELKKRMKLEIEKTIKNGHHNFISGLSLGCDIYFAEIILSLCKQYPSLTLECVIPYKKQYSSWKASQKIRYFEIIDRSTNITILSPKYYKDCFTDRNKYMVDISSIIIIAYVESKKGATYNTIDYSLSKGKIISPILIYS